MKILQIPVRHNFQITFSLSALVGESFLNKPVLPVSLHFHNVSEKAQSVLGKFYEPVFCEISLATLYTGLQVCHCI